MIFIIFIVRKISVLKQIFNPMRSRLLVFIAILLIFNKITGQKLYWSGDESHFLVSNHVLTLNAPAVSGTSYLSCIV